MSSWIPGGAFPDDKKIKSASSELLAKAAELLEAALNMVKEFREKNTQ